MLKKKVLGVIAALTLVVTGATAANALTTAEIVNLLIAAGVPADQAALLAGSLGGSSSSSSASCSLKTASDLTIGSTGASVVELQSFLESKGYLTMPAGVSKGTFGPLTQSALAKYQVAMGISPAAGYFGPITKASIVCSGSSSNDDDDADTGSTDDLEGGEASLESFDISSGDDSEVEEGASAEIAEIEFDVEDGDVLINRVDLALVADSGNDAGTDSDPWDVFDSLRLLVDGKEIAEADLSDEDEYLDEDDGTIRLSGINYIVREGETATIVVEVTAQNSVDDADTNPTWEISVLEDGIRATDAEGIEQYIPSSESDVVEFDVVVEGEGEELNVSSSSEDPETSTLKVEEDSKSDEHTIFAFELESEESDIELDTIQIELETGTAAVNNVISDLVLEIDGESFDDWSFVSGGTTTNAVVEFDIDGDFTLDADESVTVLLIAEFKAANDSNYASSGETITASIADNAVEGEGADDVVSDGTANGEEHALEIAGIIVPESGFSDEGSTSNNDENTSRDFEFSFEVTAFEEDFYIATSSIAIFVEGAGTTTNSFTVDSTGEEDVDGVFTVKEGETEVFTVVVTISDVNLSGQYRVGLDSVDYTENSDGVSETSTKDVVNSDFRTAYRTVNQ